MPGLQRMEMRVFMFRYVEEVRRYVEE